MLFRIFLVLLLVPFHSLVSQQADVPASPDLFKKSQPVLPADHHTSSFEPGTLAVGLFRTQFCSLITQHVSRNEMVIDTRLMRISKQAAAKYSWDVISFAFIEAMKGKEIDQIWYPSFKTANNLFIQNSIAYRLRRIIPHSSRDSKLYECAKDQLRVALAQTIMWGIDKYIFSVVKQNTLALARALLEKNKSS